jgi:hypothetical protein
VRREESHEPNLSPGDIASPALLATIADMAGDQGDVLRDRFVTVMLKAGPAQERPSRYGDKPALFAGSREIAHLQAPGVIDLRITRAGWSRVRAQFCDDPAVWHDPSRRDRIELHLRSVADLDRLCQLPTTAMAAKCVNSKICPARA